MQKLPSILILLYTSFFVNSQLLAQTVDPNSVDGQIHFKINTDPGINLDGYVGGNLALDALLATAGLDSIFKPFPLAGTELDSIYRLVFANAGVVNTLITALEGLPYVEFAEKNPIVEEFLTPNDFQSNQWALEKIQAELAWNYTTGSSNVLVAVLDDAIAIDHEDLNANIYVNTAEQGGFPLLDDDLNGQPDDINGYDVADGNADPRPPANASGNSDGFSHGTHVTGIVSAVTDNNTGIASIGFNTTILPVKIGRDSDGALTGASDGIYYALRSGADVINMSWGTTTDAATLRSLMVQAAAADIVLVAAAGNDGQEIDHYPAAYPEVMSVAATNQNDERASFSNYGTTIDVCAPGEGIYSTLPENNNTYGSFNGTSMATPLVAGLAALVKAHFPSFSAVQIRNRIEQSCEDISAQNPGLNGKLGAGRINAFQTLGNVGIIDVASATFNVYPNPASDVLQIDCADELRNGQIVIRDIAGREVLISGLRESIEIGHLKSGPYSISIEAENVRLTSKLIVQ